MCEHCREEKQKKKEIGKVFDERFKEYEGIKGAEKIYKELGDRSYEDLSGRKFGRLMAKKAVGRNKWCKVMWLCECECSGQIILDVSRLKSSAKSCGCMQTGKGKNLRDLTGQKFSELTVVGRAEDHIEKDGRARVQWICFCSCGGTIIVKSRQLLKGIITRCDECNPKKRRIGHKLNLVGKKFGKWTVLTEAPQSKTRSGHTRWICKCDCGTIRDVDGGHLTQLKSTSCGCSKKENTFAADLLNQKFGRWTVVEKLGKDKNNNMRWRCICDCGAEGIHTSHKLLSGGSSSCGCLKRDKAHARRENLVGQKFNMVTVLERAEDHIYPSGARRPMYWCLCDCGQKFKTYSNSLKNGTCKSCGCLFSHGERVISELLENNNIRYKKQKSYKDLLSDKGKRLRFDFYILDENYLIEFDGMYHYKASKRIWCTEEHVKKTQYHDKLKNKYCKKNKIPLIRIPYTHLKGIRVEDLKLETTKFRVA